ncbi:hypothetical protein HDU84_000729 [Entophlyctis sp. JEL0112]|nr:hypothetical protein HDU84_000729 [Entophlyctis sp. JEL0112]
MIKMADKGLFVVYCSFMNASSSGFPRRSKIADTLLDLRQKNIFSLYFAACFDEAMKYKNNHGEFLKLQMDQSTHDGFWASIELSMDNLAKNSKFLSAPLSHPVFAGNKTLEILFVFDEARAMIPDQIGSVSAFIEMRRSATLFMEKCRAFVIMMDTTSRVSALAPAAAKDSSYRVQTGHQIFTPLFLLGSMDVGLQTLYGSKMDDALTRRVQYKRGRPLWQSLLDGYSSLVVRDTAIRKMNGGFTNLAIPEFELPFAATVIRSRVPFVVHRFELASELVASHMWWCVQISDDRQHLVVTMPSEPVIAEAGACWLNDVGHRIEILKIFVNALSQMYFDVGTNGETVAQLVLIFGRDRVRRALPEESDSSPVRPIPVRNYFSFPFR